MSDDQLLLDNLIRHFESEGLTTCYVRIMREGDISAEYNRIRLARLPVWSISKGFASIAVGIAMDEGLISIEDKVVDIFPELCAYRKSDNLDDVTLYHLLTMSSGLKSDSGFEREDVRHSDIDHLALFFGADFETPGTRWRYSSLSTYVLARAIEKKASMGFLEYLNPRLFDKIDIKNPEWDTCLRGHAFGGFGLHLTIEEMARYSTLILNYGQYRKNRVVSRRYMEEATTCKFDNSDMLRGEKKAFWGYGYGYHFAMNPMHGFRSDGMFGQFAIALPDIGVSIAMMSLEDNTARLGTLLYEELVNRL